jgi:hypothetical protein
VANISFPTYPSVGDLYSQNNSTFMWNGKTWVNITPNGIIFSLFNDIIELPSTRNNNTVYCVMKSDGILGFSDDDILLGYNDNEELLGW